MKLLILTRYDRRGASSRLRSFQYVPYLRSIGMEVEIQCLFDQEYLEKMYKGKRSARQILGSFGRRLKMARTIRECDLVWLEKEALPWVPWLVESLFLGRGTPLITDYDDAIFHRYDIHRSSLIRRLLGEKIDKVMARSSVVLAGNPYLAQRAKAAGAPRIELIPTVVDLDLYRELATRAGSPVPKVGWIGTPETWNSFVSPFVPLFQRFVERGEATFLVVGAGGELPKSVPFETAEWTEDTEVDLLRSFDIGVMPLPDSPWTRGKCGYKLIQYMACGLPVIASPVGVNREIVEHGLNGFIASTDQEWEHALTTLVNDPGLRIRMGLAGRQKVESSYSLQEYGPRVTKLLMSIAQSKPRII